MRNFKKLLAVLVVVVMMATAMIPAMAADNYTYSAEAQKLHDLGLFDGTSATSFVPDLGSALTREQGVKLLLSTLGQAGAAAAMTKTEVDTILKSYTDAGKVSDWARPYVAYAIKAGYVTGTSATTIGPDEALLGKAYATMLLRSAGYAVNAADYDVAASILVDKGGLTATQALRFNDKNLLRDDVVGMTYGCLNAKLPSGKTVIETLVTAGVVDAKKAFDAGVNPQYAVVTAAQDAVAAYEAAKITTADEITAAAALETAATEAIAKVTDATVSAALTAKVTAQKALVVAAAAKIVSDAAETAVAAYEAAPIDTLANVTLAEALKAPADTAVTAVTDTLKKAAFQTRLDTKTAAITAAKTTLGSVDSASVASISTTTVFVTLNTASAKAASDISVAIKDAAGNAVTISTVVLSTDKKTVKVTTPAQTPGAAYTLTIDGKAYTYVAMPADTTKPAVSTAIALSNTSLKVTFAATDLDADTALVATNYSVSGLTITNAAFGATRDIVILTTSEQTAGALYTLTVANVTDKAGNVIATPNSKLFAGAGKDTTAPTVSAVGVVSNTKIEVTFTEVGTLDPNTALAVGNYSINGLTVTAAEFKASTNVLGGTPVVSLTTSAQTAGTLYTVTVSGVKDATGNVMAAAATKYFAGVAPDTTEVSVSSAVATAYNKVKIVFDDTVTKDTAEVAANYTFDNNLVASSAALDANDTTNKTVIVTTTEQVAGTLYKVTVANVKDVAGNGTKATANNKLFAGAAKDTTAPTIADVLAISNTSVKVVFNEKVTKDSAQNILNYNINNSLGYPAAAVLASDGLTVTLTTAPQSSIVYTITINNVVNETGLTIAANSTKAFGGFGSTSAALKMTSATALNANTIRVIFSEDITAPTGANFIVSSDRAGASADTTDIAYTTTAGTTTLADKFANNVDYTIVTVDAKTYDIVFKSAVTAKAGSVYTFTVTGITGKYGKLYSGTAADATTQFAGTPVARPDVALQLAQAVDSRTLKMTFSEKVDISGIDVTAIKVYEGTSATVASDVLIATGTGTAVKSSDGLSVSVTMGADLASNKVYYLELGDAAAITITDLSKMFKVKGNATAGTADFTFATGTVTAVTANTPEITGAVMTNVNTVEVIFNRPITETLAMNITDWNIYNDAATPVALLANTDMKDISVSASDPTRLVVKFSKALTTSTSGVYTFKVETAGLAKVVSASGAVALSSTKNTSTFAVSTIANDKPALASASAVADKIALISFSKTLSVDAAVYLKLVNKTSGRAIDPTDYTISVSGSVYKTYLVTLNATAGSFAAGNQYEVYVDSACPDTVTADYGLLTVAKDDSTTTAHENAVTFAGTAAVSALTIDPAQVTLTYGANDVADSIAFSATAGLAANQYYNVKLATGTVEVLTAADKSVATTLIGASVTGVTGAVESISIYDMAGNLVATGVAKTAL